MRWPVSEGGGSVKNRGAGAGVRAATPCRPGGVASRWLPEPGGAGNQGRAAVDPGRLMRLSVANPLWGAPRIHGELLKLGMDVGRTTVAKSMAKRRRPPSQGWRIFVHNHADAIASIDM